MDNAAIYSDEENLLEIIEILFEISCNGIPNYFKEVEKIESENENLAKFAANKEEILKEINRQLTVSKDKEANCCTAEYFLKKFEQDRLVILKFLFN